MKGELFDWSESKQGFEHQIESTKMEALKEWEEIRKPDEWDMALDQGKTKKTHRNKVSMRRPRKNNPFQTVAEKKQKKHWRVCWRNEHSGEKTESKSNKQPITITHQIAESPCS